MTTHRCASRMQPREGGREHDRDEKSSPSEAKPCKERLRRRIVMTPKRKDAERNSDKMRGREERVAEDARQESQSPGIDAARVARLRAIERRPFDKFSDLGLRRGARRARSVDSTLSDSARTPAPACEGRQNRFPPHDSRGDAARRCADRSQLPRATAASCRSRDPRRHFGFRPLCRAVDARTDGRRARMLSPRQQFRLCGPSGGGGLRAGPSGNDAGAGLVRAL